MTMTDDQRLADQLRAVFDEHSAGVAPLVDRRAAVARRVTRRKQARVTAGLAAMLLIVSGLTGLYVLAGGPNRGATPAVHPTGSAGPLPRYSDGGRLVAAATIDQAKQTSETLQFTLTSYPMALLASCHEMRAGFRLRLSVDGRSAGDLQCPGTATYTPHREFWSELGLGLGDRSTLTVELVPVKEPESGAPATAGTVASGTASVGVYESVPLDQYPLPPKPKDWSPVSAVHYSVDNSMHKIGQIGQFGVISAEARNITLPRHLDFLVEMSAPGLVTVLVDGKPVVDCVSYGWGLACDSGIIDVGTGELAGLVPGGEAAVTVQAQQLAEPNTVQVLVYGK